MKHKHAELIKKWADGAKIGVYSNGVLVPCTNPLWQTDCRYDLLPPSRFSPIAGRAVYSLELNSSDSLDEGDGIYSAVTNEGDHFFDNKGDRDLLASELRRLAPVIRKTQALIKTNDHSGTYLVGWSTEDGSWEVLSHRTGIRSLFEQTLSLPTATQLAGWLNLHYASGDLYETL